MIWIQSLLDWALAALGTHGYLIVFFATVLENLFIVGSFTPGDVITAAAAFTATTAQGQALSPWLLFGTATLGTFVGTNMSYLIGLRGGRELIERIGPKFGINLNAIEAGEEYFAKHGAQTIVFARFVAVMKNLAPALAGASRMNLMWFEVYNLLGAAGYAGILVGVGWFLGANFRAGLKYLGAFSWLVFVAVVIVGIVLWASKRHHDRRLIAQLDAEFDAEQGGPLSSASDDEPDAETDVDLGAGAESATKPHDESRR